MSRIGKILKGFGEAAEEITQLFRRGEKQEANVVNDAAKAAPKKKMTPEETKEYLAEQATRTAKTKAATDVSETLSALTPGRFGRNELDARLKALSDKATENKLIDGLMQSDRSAKKVEEALLKGEKVSAKEMVSLQKSKLSAFEDYEAQAVKDAIRNERAAKGERTFGDRIKSWGANTLMAGASVLGLGGAALGIDHVVNDGKIGDFVGNVGKSWGYGAKAKVEIAQQQSTTRAAQNCRADAGSYGEVTGNCIKSNFGGNFESLQEVFTNQLTSEPDRVYLNCLGKNLEIADANSPTTEAFTKAAAQARNQCINELKTSKEYKDHQPDFNYVDSKVKMALGWN